MRQKVLFAVLAASVALSAWLHLTTRQVITPPPRREMAARRRPEPAPVDAVQPGEVRRNLFEYADAAAPKPVDQRKPAPVSTATEAPTPAPSVRLVGIVHSGPAPRAALSSQGQVVMAVAGEVVDGYVVLSIDEQEGVRLKAPSGIEILLAPPR